MTMFCYLITVPAFILSILMSFEYAFFRVLDTKKGQVTACPFYIALFEYANSIDIFNIY